MHSNSKRLPHNHLGHAVITYVIKNYTEENAILLPGRIPRHKRDDIKLLPSSRSKKVSLRISKIYMLNNMSTNQAACITKNFVKMYYDSVSLVIEGTVHGLKGFSDNEILKFLQFL